MPTMTLPDRRTAAYLDTGDPQGAPVVYCGGFQTSLAARHPDDGLAAAAGIRLIGVERPGYGESTRNPGGGLPDSAADLGHLLDHLGIARAAALGWSLGGLHALAAARYLGERISRVVTMASIGPMDEPGALRHLHWTGALPQRLRRVPPLQRAWFSLLARQAVNDSATFAATAAKASGETPSAVAADENYRAALERAFAEAYRQGPGGVMDDYNLVTPLPFWFSDIPQHVAVYHGDQDTTVAPAMARALVRRLPNAELHLIPGAGHLSLFAYWEELLRAAAPDVAGAAD
jgi:pimeloyl-ACP methyl ester carboxylesterase